MSLQTEYEFTLPKGFVDGDGNLHTKGKMRLATARDEVEPLRDNRVSENEAYLTIIILARVITELGSLTHINPQVVENLFASDIAFLQDFYGIVNFGDPETLTSLDADRPFVEPSMQDMAAAPS